jgi:hypothetical protein
MVNDEIKKKSITKKEPKNPESTGLIYKTRDSGYKTSITLQKAN